MDKSDMKFYVFGVFLVGLIVIIIYFATRPQKKLFDDKDDIKLVLSPTLYYYTREKFINDKRKPSGYNSLIDFTYNIKQEVRKLSEVEASVKLDEFNRSHFDVQDLSQYLPYIPSDLTNESLNYDIILDKSSINLVINFEGSAEGRTFSARTVMPIFPNGVKTISTNTAYYYMEISDFIILSQLIYKKNGLNLGYEIKEWNKF